MATGYADAYAAPCYLKVNSWSPACSCSFACAQTYHVHHGNDAPVKCKSAAMKASAVSIPADLGVESSTAMWAQSGFNAMAGAVEKCQLAYGYQPTLSVLCKYRAYTEPSISSTHLLQSVPLRQLFQWPRGDYAANRVRFRRVVQASYQDRQAQNPQGFVRRSDQIVTISRTLYSNQSTSLPFYNHHSLSFINFVLKTFHSLSKTNLPRRTRGSNRPDPRVRTVALGLYTFKI